MIDLVTVVFREELPILKLQAQSVDLYCQNIGIKNTFQVNLEVGVEPRWYWGYKKKYLAGISDLNSGWYLSFPTLFQTILLNTPEPALKLRLTPNYFQITASISPTLGFRQAISKRWFLEGQNNKLEDVQE